MTPADWAPLTGAAVAIATAYVAHRRAQTAERRTAAKDAAELRRAQVVSDEAAWKRLNDMLTSMQSALSGMRHDLVAREERIAELQRENRELLSRFEERDRQFESLQQENRDLRDQLDDLKRQLTAVGREMPGGRDPNKRTREDD